MRARSFPQHELERLALPWSREVERWVHEQPEAVCRVLAPLLSDDRLARIERVLGDRLRSFVFVLDHLHDPHNRAAILRTAEAMGVLEVHVVQADGRWPLSRRVTQGCHKWLEVVVHRSADRCADRLEERGFRLIEASEKCAVDERVVPATEQMIALCFGNEHKGPSAELSARCHGRIGVEMRGFTRSFNVSVAAALLAAELVAGRKRGLDEGDALSLRARYYALSVRNVDQVLRREVGR